MIRAGVATHLSGDPPDDGFRKFRLGFGATSRGIVDADIESLERAEREFIKKVCASIHIFRAYGQGGCPVVAYGHVELESLCENDWLNPWHGVNDHFRPVFRVEAVEFLGLPRP